MWENFIFGLTYFKDREGWGIIVPALRKYIIHIFSTGLSSQISYFSIFCLFFLISSLEYRCNKDNFLDIGVNLNDIFKVFIIWPVTFQQNSRDFFRILFKWAILYHTGSKIFRLSLYGNIGFKTMETIRGGRKVYQCYQNYHLIKGWIHSDILFKLLVLRIVTY